ncbi:MAG: hypothetical protein IKT10_01310 [Clostridiales bacterium]|nr:hypothetical protein [Clostridiales bacterium]
MKECPKCSAPCKDYDKFCSSCGFVLPENTDIEVPAKPAAETSEPAEDPVKQKEKISASCIIGAAFSGTYILASIVYWIIQAFENYYEMEIPAKWIFFFIGVICLPTGFFVSIASSATARERKKKTSRKLGLSGIWGAGAGLVSNILVLVIVLVCGIVEFNKFEHKDYDTGSYVIRYKTNDLTQAEARAYYWDGDPQHNHIKLESVNGAKIVRLNDFVVKVKDDQNYYKSIYYDRYIDPRGGGPEIKERYLGIEPGTLIYKDTVIFTVEINKDIEKISMNTHTSKYTPRELAVINPDGSISFYKHFFQFEVDPENPYYYSENGILYSKKNNRKVNAFYPYEDEAMVPRSSEIAPGETTETTEETITEATETEKRTFIYGSGPEKINLWAYTDEVPKMVNQYMKMYPKFGTNYTVECTVIDTGGGQYENALDNALVAGGDIAPDIYVVEAGFVVKYTQGDMSKFASTYEDLGINTVAGIKEAEIAQYTIDIGSRNGKLVALGFQGTGGVMIYNAQIAKEVFGTDDPEEIERITGAGTGKWDKFLEAAAKLKSKGYAAVSGPYDVWNVCDKSAVTPWVVNGKLTIDPKREEYLDLTKSLKDNGYFNDTYGWSEDWFKDMSGNGEQKVFAYFGPAWLINYVMVGNCGGSELGEGTYGQWRVCAPPKGFYWGGTWILANKDTDQKEGVAELIEWITLDSSDTGLQYLWANGLIDWDNDPETKTAKDSVASGKVMARSDGTLDFCGGQDIFPAFIQANNFATGKGASQYDEIISGYYENAARDYAKGEIDRNEAIKKFKKEVTDSIAF